MIVRLMGEGQFRVDDACLAKLDKLDDSAMEALGRDDEGELDARLDEMWAVVKERGTQLDDADLSPSDLIIPPSDLTLEETRELFSEQGLIPDLPSEKV
ncbi:MAG: hypothetical protein H0U07_02125 [Actinobacteria bacterium]|jgi:hypothetical protein|nr:hypothetical protein [Actinomycetota bacterium]MDQ3163552.1 hypothetical protein [Actinomycetota bacterium]